MLKLLEGPHGIPSMLPFCWLSSALDIVVVQVLDPWYHWIGSLDQQLLTLHLTEASDEEAALNAQRGARSALCSGSIGTIDGIVPPAHAFRQAGGLVALGSDQACGNSCNSVFNEVKLTALLNKCRYCDANRELTWGNAMRIEAFHSQDLGELIQVWNRNLPADPISPARLEARVLLDPNFRETYFLAAREEARIVGFALGICGEGFCYQARQVPPEQMGSMAWILALAVEGEYRGRGVGSALVRELEGRFRAAGRREVWIASYPTAYIVPGVDGTAYAEGLGFLQGKGYRVAYTALAMDATLWPPAFPEGAIQREQDLATRGIAFHTYAPRWLSAFRAFLREEVPWDWEWLALRNLARVHEGTFAPEQIHLAIHEERVVGYCQYEGAHYGPFGVAEGFQGNGIGTVLLARALASMVERDLHHAWVLWTGERAARLYARFGFRVNRRFAVLNKEMQ